MPFFVPIFVPIFLLMALSFFLGQGFFPTSLSAQETQVPTDSQYPILNESDFLLTLKVLDNIEAGPDNF
ncbi:MAG: hypothetical protein LBF40_00610, partial [Deltaproteobacteria bacterium]|nr:hypothetical protein [Deltaproteobacteria bacterium]